jgi:hypothetical protein
MTTTFFLLLALFVLLLLLFIRSTLPGAARFLPAFLIEGGAAPSFSDSTDGSGVLCTRTTRTGVSTPQGADTDREEDPPRVENTTAG